MRAPCVPCNPRHWAGTAGGTMPLPPHIFTSAHSPPEPAPGLPDLQCDPDPRDLKASKQLLAECKDELKREAVRGGVP